MRTTGRTLGWTGSGDQCFMALNPFKSVSIILELMKTLCDVVYGCTTLNSCRVISTPQAKREKKTCRHSFSIGTGRFETKAISFSIKHTNIHNNILKISCKRTSIGCAYYCLPYTGQQVDRSNRLSLHHALTRLAIALSSSIEPPEI